MNVFTLNSPRPAKRPYPGDRMACLLYLVKSCLAVGVVKYSFLLGILSCISTSDVWAVVEREGFSSFFLHLFWFTADKSSTDNVNRRDYCVG